ncbi:MAG: hypothetical protein LiPW15_731 [Parcubacteria group bacterium LiPW_15]|nr:MAG: hypothetical protein LiPW15_731 [Parcubacteria group bacterium LiPW_15]
MFPIVISVLLTVAVMLFATGLLLKFQKEAFNQKTLDEKIKLADVKFAEGIAYANNLKRFGLREAFAAAKFVKNADGASTVLGVVVGVLGFQNVVAEDVDGRITNLFEYHRRSEERIKEASASIEWLKAKVATEYESIGKFKREIAELHGLVALFSGPPETPDVPEAVEVPEDPEGPAESSSIVDEEA